MQGMRQAVVVGAGSFGTAMAAALVRRGLEVWLWGRNEAVVGEINRSNTNLSYLPGVHLPGELRATTDLSVTAKADLLLMGVPSQQFRSVCEQLQGEALKATCVLLSGTKGMEKETGQRMTEILQEMLPQQNEAVLSGPAHAEEVAREMPTAMVIGSANEDVAVALQEVFTLPWLRTYTSTDVLGIEIGGTFKNIAAIAGGIVEGLGLGDNAKAGLVTRALAEMVRIGVAMGAHPETFMGLSGVGDLLATCYSNHSRNTRVGRMLGMGKSWVEVRESLKMVAEGVPNTESVYHFARRHEIRTPVTDVLYEVILERLHPAEAARQLLSRSPRPEMD